MSALSDAYALLKTGTLWSSTGKCKGYATSNPGEAAKIDSYVAAISDGQSVSPPVLVTATGRGIVGMLAALLPAPDPPPPPPPPTSTKHLGLIKFGGGLTSYASRIGEYSLVCVSDGDAVDKNPRTLIYCNGMKIRYDGGSGVNFSSFQSLGYDTGVFASPFPANFAKVANTGFQNWFAKQVVALAVSYGAGGVFLDDLAMQARDNAGGYNDSRTQSLFGVNLSGFQSAMIALAAVLGVECRAHGLYLLANCNAYVSGVQDSAFAETDWVGRNATSLNGAMNESFMTLRDGSNTRRNNSLGATSAGWSTLVNQFESKGVDCIGLTYGDINNAKYGYASMLTQATRPGSCFMWGSDNDPVQLLDLYKGTASINLDAGTAVVA